MSGARDTPPTGHLDQSLMDPPALAVGAVCESFLDQGPVRVAVGTAVRLEIIRTHAMPQPRGRQWSASSDVGKPSPGSGICEISWPTGTVVSAWAAGGVTSVLVCRRVVVVH